MSWDIVGGRLVGGAYMHCNQESRRNPPIYFYLVSSHVLGLTEI